MGRPSKRKLLARNAATSKKLKTSSAPHQTPTFSNESEEDGYSSTSSVSDWSENFSEAEDEWPIGKPDKGWKEAERNTTGYSRVRTGTYAQSRYYYRQKAKKTLKDEESIRKQHYAIQSYFQPINHSINTVCPVQEKPRNTVDIASQDQEESQEDDQQEEPARRENLNRDILEFDIWADEKLKGAGKIWTTRIKLARSLLKLEKNKPEFSPISDSLVLAYSADKGIKFAQQLRRWVNDWKVDRLGIPEPRLSNHARRKTLFEDEGIMIAVREYLNENSWHSTVDGVVKTVEDVTASRRCVETMRIKEANDDCQPNTTISTRTAARWLAKLGWVYERDGKGYVDGHEREDVVAYRNNVFLPKMTAFEPEMSEFDENGEISKPCTKFVLVTHDESTFSANDDESYHWKLKGTQPLKSKSRGKGLMVSDFLTADDGRLRFQDPTTDKVEQACEIINYGNGKDDDGYWTAEKMIAQVKEKAIPLFEKRFPGKKGIFAFDNSSGHAAFAVDALVASRMNLNPGGAQPKMHDTIFNNHPQSMVFSHNDAPSSDLVGQAKGIRQVLLERGLWVQGLKKRCVKKKGVVSECKKGKTCCAFRILEGQPDFMNEVSLLETTIRGLGHECIFYPKFHCEFNFIEFFWAAVKRYTRAHCDYSFLKLETTVREGLDSVSLQTIRRFSMRSKRWMISYRDGGMGTVERAFAEKMYRSHRREPKQLMLDTDNSGASGI